MKQYKKIRVQQKEGKRGVSDQNKHYKKTKFQRLLSKAEERLFSRIGEER